MAIVRAGLRHVGSIPAGERSLSGLRRSSWITESDHPDHTSLAVFACAMLDPFLPVNVRYLYYNAAVGSLSLIMLDPFLLVNVRSLDYNAALDPSLLVNVRSLDYNAALDPSLLVNVRSLDYNAALDPSLLVNVRSLDYNAAVGSIPAGELGSQSLIMLDPSLPLNVRSLYYDAAAGSHESGRGWPSRLGFSSCRSPMTIVRAGLRHPDHTSLTMLDPSLLVNVRSLDYNAALDPSLLVNVRSLDYNAAVGSIPAGELGSHESGRVSPRVYLQSLPFANGYFGSQSLAVLDPSLPVNVRYPYCNAAARSHESGRVDLRLVGSIPAVERSLSATMTVQLDHKVRPFGSQSLIMSDPSLPVNVRYLDYDAAVGSQSLIMLDPSLPVNVSCLYCDAAVGHTSLTMFACAVAIVMGESSTRELAVLATFFDDSGALPRQPEANRLAKKFHTHQNQRPFPEPDRQIPHCGSQKQLSLKKTPIQKKPNSRQGSSHRNWTDKELEALVPFIERLGPLFWKDRVKVWNAVFHTGRSVEALRGQYYRITWRNPLNRALGKPSSPTGEAAEASCEPRRSSVGRPPTSTSGSLGSRLTQRISISPSGTRGIGSDSRTDPQGRESDHVARAVVSDNRQKGPSHVLTIDELLSTCDSDEDASKEPTDQNGEVFRSPHQRQASVPRMHAEISQQASANPREPLLSDPACLCPKRALDEGCERPSSPVVTPTLTREPSPRSGRSSTADQSEGLRSSPSPSLASSWTSHTISIPGGSDDRLPGPDDSQFDQSLHDQLCGQLWGVLETQSGPPQTPPRQDQEAQIKQPQMPARQDRATQTDSLQDLEPQSLVLQKEPQHKDPPGRRDGYPAKRQKRNGGHRRPLDVSPDRNPSGHSSASASSARGGSTWRDWALGGLWARGN
ncbi:hypothetical protein N7474_004988 [Penicillium riverlandense]|uniref:uncharacterized protein n=1 Tax=Penicillium riverlandense TaxID=1903569 RepID=UPI0025469484|nr:uncharacterized protein N7474_004988 [Penicillium riverlandense]KAJ5819397.1 hypothetical protein N7474_004988 [Penicillium riverlandense]